ncbi:prolactin [Rhynchocyon petersi]
MAREGSSPKGSRLLLLLLLVNLLLCKTVASMPSCLNRAANCQMSLQDMFDRALYVSNYMHNLSTDMFSEFDRRYAQGRGYITRALNSCHTSSLPTPEDKEQAQKIHAEELLRLIVSILHSWNEPLTHLVSEMRSIQGAPNTLLSKAIEIEEQNKRLLEGMEKIIGQVQPEAKGNYFYSVWSGLPPQQVNDEDHRNSGVYSLSHCLNRDTHKIYSFLKVLSCRLIYKNNC